jgi:aldehyde dehydrogenase (NAD+)
LYAVVFKNIPGTIGGDKFNTEQAMSKIKREWKNYIDGEWVDSGSGKKIDVLDPATGEKCASIACADAGDVDRAVKAAQRAIESRALYEMKPHDRMRLIMRIAQWLRDHREEIADVICAENGRSISLALDEPDDAATYLEYYAGLAGKLHGRSIPLGEGFVDYTQLIPIGVSAQIIPWNFPMEIAARGMGPALACGNAIVMKSPELSPLGMAFLADACEAAGLPKGYFNVIAGYGHEAGEALASHPGINQIVFTGSVPTGRRIMKNAAELIVPSLMELGGKSAGIVYPDANLDEVAHSAAIGIFVAGGQVCSAGSRLIVHSSIHDELVQKIADWTRQRTMGPGCEDHFFTPLISEQQRDKAEAFCQQAVKDGATAVIGGKRPDNRPGFFLEPTILTNVSPNSAIAQEEVFGPVLTVLKFDEPEEAVAIANNTEYGLCAGVYTQNLKLAHWTADRLMAGSIYVNKWYAGGQEAPFGGIKKSGFGREKGVEGMSNYYQTRNVAIKL